jgi:hypothetical protein
LEIVMRSIHTFALAFCLAAAPLAHADDATHRAKAEEMLKLTQTESTMKDQLANLQERVNTLAKQQFSTQATLTPEQSKMIDDYLKQVQTITDDEVGWTKMRATVVQSYADTFTDADLDGIITFYKSPAGQAIITKTPVLATKTMGMIQDKIKEMQPKLAQLTQDYGNKIKATAPAPAGAPALAAPPATPAAKPAAPAPRP